MLTKKFIILISLPGSGKSFYGNNLRKQYGALCCFMDDIFHMDEIKAVAPHFNTLIFCDPNLCDEINRRRCVDWLKRHYPSADIQLIFFENNAEQCRKNVSLRNDGRKVEGTIRRFEKTYKVPNSYQAVPVWRPCI